MKELPTVTQAFPPMPLVQLQRCIAEFPRQSLIEQRELIDRLVSTHPTLNLKYGTGHRFQRARILNANEVPTGIDDVIWPTTMPARPGRANHAGVRLFYLADWPATALHEVGVSDHWCCISEFAIQDGRNVHIVPIGEFSQIMRVGRGFMSGDASAAITGILRACAPEEAESLIRTDAFLYEQMVGHDNYDLSAAVAAAIFGKLKNVSVVGYSSRRRAGSMNFAAATEKFWDDWKLLSIVRAHITRSADGQFSSSDVSAVRSVSACESLRWSPAGPDGSYLPIETPYIRRPPS